MSAARPVIGVMCCNEVASRPVQTVATRFIEPLATIAGATVLLVPAVIGFTDARGVADALDGLLLTGSRSNVAADRYGGIASGDASDVARDEVALALADRMIVTGKPVFGICRGLQELNVLFGGSLYGGLDRQRHHRGSWDGDYDTLFDHHHEVALSDGGLLRIATGAERLTVNSVHEQGIDRLGSGLSIEAIASDDGLIEAISARSCGAAVLGVQWHPEWDAAHSSASRAFFAMIGDAMRAKTGIAGQTLPAPRPRPGSGWALRGH